MSKLKKPIRMCIICRGRFEQNTLTRFQVNRGKIIPFLKIGRSSYICDDCMSEDNKKIVRVMNSKFKFKYKKLEELGDFFSSKVRKHN
jgi:predicted RNA-binding protein YlxR (DUF448 family)